MSELSFLIELLLNHKLPKATQIAIKARIDDIQQPATLNGQHHAPLNGMPTIPIKTPPAVVFHAPPVPIENVAQTPAAQAALAQRQAMINAQVNRQIMPGTNQAPKVHGNL